MTGRARIVVQARLSSKRLPAKALLPVGGLPMVVLAARRAARDGLDVVVATSDRPEDDLLAAVVAEHGVRVVRGSLEDVLGRIIVATADLDDDDAVVRLTADNVVPDAAFVRLMLDAWTRTDGYLSSASSRSRLPYGVSAEVVAARLLRAADRSTSDPADREHVTPWVRRSTADAALPPPLDADLSGYRCTVDNLFDYRRIVALFTGVPDAIGAPWRELCDELTRSTEPALDRFVLGTAQLGMPYGVTNVVGMPTESEAVAIVAAAVDAGVRQIDTAHAYGPSERRLGDALTSLGRPEMKVITKVEPLDELLLDAPELACDAECSVLRSLHELGVERLDTALLHRGRLLGSSAWVRLRELRDEGTVGTVGVSVTSPAELEVALADPDVGHVQMPFNVVDRRWAASRALLDSRPDVVVHARSALLQGLLASTNASAWPQIDGFDVAALLHALAGLVRDLDRLDVADLCFAYVRAQPWIDGVVVGVATTGEIASNAERFRRRALTADEVATVEAIVPTAPDLLVDPSRWVWR